MLTLGLELNTPAWSLCHMDGELSTVISRFRTGNHRLPIETCRWTGKHRSDRLCVDCDQLGDEYHAIFECSTFNDHRVPLAGYISDLSCLPRELAVCEFLDPKDASLARKVGRFLLRIEKTLSDNHSDSDIDGVG